MYFIFSYFFILLFDKKQSIDCIGLLPHLVKPIPERYSSNALK